MGLGLMVMRHMMNDDIIFNTMDSEGHVTHIKTLSRDTIGRCPSFILLASHYRDDGSCRHDEPNCEEDGCTNLKYNGEIHCKPHLQSLYGEYLDE